MEYLGMIGVILALLTMIFMITRGYHAAFAGLVASSILIVANDMPLLETLVGPEASFVAEMGGFIIENYMVVLLGSVLATLLERSGATYTIAQKVIEVVGADHPYSVMLAIFLIACILTYGGVSFFVVIFMVLPMARPLFKTLNIPWTLVTIPIFGGMSTVTMSMLPGTPSIPNILPANYLGTPLTSEAFLGIAASAGAVIFILLWMATPLSNR